MGGLWAAGSGSAFLSAPTTGLMCYAAGMNAERVVMSTRVDMALVEFSATRAAYSQMEGLYHNTAEVVTLLVLNAHLRSLGCALLVE